MSKIRADRDCATEATTDGATARPRRRIGRWLVLAGLCTIGAPVGLFAVNFGRTLWGDARHQSLAEIWNVTTVDSAAIAPAPALAAAANHWAARMNELYAGLIVRHWATPGGDLVVVLNPGFYRLLTEPEQLGAIEDLTEHWRYTLMNALGAWPTSHGFAPGLVVVALRAEADGSARAVLDIRADVRDGRATLYRSP